MPVFGHVRPTKAEKMSTHWHKSSERLSLSWVYHEPMGTLDALKARYDMAKNMFVRNRNGVAFGRDGFSQKPLPSDHERPEGPIESYAKAHTTGLGIHKWDHYVPVYARPFAKLRGP